MKIIILCGGLGTRLAEETTVKPKPMVEIGGKPILWHIMKIYEKYAFSDFILALGYKGEVIKEYFLDYHKLQNDIVINFNNNSVDYINQTSENWKVSLIDTGSNTMTGGRLLRLREVLKNEETFMLTYGDGVSDIDISKLLQFHNSHGKIATITAVTPSARFGGINIKNGNVVDFKEKPNSGEGLINGGFFVFQRKIFDYISDDSTMLEHSPLENLVKDNQLMAYVHDGFWQCMDTIRDKEVLQKKWEEGNASW